jgi:glycosyltransferase involved in cell wall biosynthesis
MAEVVFAVPGDLATPTGGYAYARKLLELLPRHGIAISPLILPAAYPDPSASDLETTARLVAGTPPDAVLLIDGLAYGAMPADLIAGFRRPVVALVHHPLGLEHGLSPSRQAELLASEAQALALARRVIVTSALTGRLLAANFNVRPDAITVAEPGTEAVARARGSGSPVQILAVGAVSPRKGYEVLVAALQDLADLDWRATIAGATDRNPEAAQSLRQAIVAAGLPLRVTLTGAVTDEALAALYAQTDVFVSPSLFEGYGMVLAEALAHGLPVVASTGGAAAETLPDEAALKVPQGDAAALARALRQAITDPDLRARLAAASWEAGQALPRWPDTAARVAAALQETAGPGEVSR